MCVWLYGWLYENRLTPSAFDPPTHTHTHTYAKHRPKKNTHNNMPGSKPNSRPPRMTAPHTPSSLLITLCSYKEMTKERMCLCWVVPPLSHTGERKSRFRTPIFISQERGEKRFWSSCTNMGAGVWVCACVRVRVRVCSPLEGRWLIRRPSMSI